MAILSLRIVVPAVHDLRRSASASACVKATASSAAARIIRDRRESFVTLSQLTVVPVASSAPFAISTAAWSRRHFASKIPSPRPRIFPDAKLIIQYLKGHEATKALYAKHESLVSLFAEFFCGAHMPSTNEIFANVTIVFEDNQDHLEVNSTQLEVLIIGMTKALAACADYYEKRIVSTKV